MLLLPSFEGFSTIRRTLSLFSARVTISFPFPGAVSVYLGTCLRMFVKVGLSPSSAADREQLVRGAGACLRAAHPLVQGCHQPISRQHVAGSSRSRDSRPWGGTGA